MTIQAMHYDYKQKLNVIDSQKYRNLEVPEIDWKLNEAQEVFIKMIAEPRVQRELGFEFNQRTIDDIRTVVKDQKLNEYTTATVFDESSFIVGLPIDYWFLAKIKIIASKGKCKNILLYDSQSIQHDDNAEASSFDKSSFEWRAANYSYNSQGIRIFTDSTFTIDKVGFDYIMQPKRMHNAADWRSGTYEGLDGKTYTGRQDCILPEGTHREIVDLAVLITAGDLNLSSYNTKMNKLKITN